MVFSERNLGVPAESEVEVSVVDLEDWQIVRTIETVPGVGAGIWSADSEHMYVWREHCGQPADRGYCSEQWQRGLWEIDAAAGTAREVVAYDFSVIGQQVSASRERAYALAIRTDVCCGIDPEGDAFVAVIDIAAGEVIAELPMPGMFIGQPGHWLGDTTKLASYHPAISLSPDGSHLYVVDPVEDSVQIIDTMSLAVAGAIDFREKDSKLSRFEDWLASQLVGAAEAKGNPSYSRMAAITPDGRYLLISGTRAYEEPAKGRDFEWTDRPSGLVVINLATREAVLREANVGWFRVSPDGRWVLATGQYHDEALVDEDGFGGLVAFGLKVVDLQSLDVVAHGWEGGEVNIAAISPDSKYGYVITDGPGIEAFRRATPPAACGPNCRLLQVIDFNGNGVIATRSLGENESILPLTAWP
jgi:YVTN family beta-propeller protein